MCRWITVLSSEQISLSDVVLAPTNSLVQLAKDASFHPGYSDMNNHTTNGDGFGVGWYHSNAAIVPRSVVLTNEPVEGHPNMYAAVFKDTAPAWNNCNLREICCATRSHAIMAHVRAASRFASVSQENTHPFKVGRLLFCHNGRIDKFPKIRRALLSRLTEEAFILVRGTTDSECLFALIVTFLQEDGKAAELPTEQDTPFGHSRLVNAIKKTLKLIEKLLTEADITDTFSTMNFALTDGESLVVTRFCDKSPHVMPPSLYYAYGNVKELTEEITSKDPERYVRQGSAMGGETTASESDSELDDAAAASGNNPAADGIDGGHVGSPSVGMRYNNPAYSSSASLEGLTLDGDTTYDEMPIDLLMRESLPGLQYGEVDSSKATFVVSSNPLTNTHTWNPMPRNSIMWCTRGHAPELRLLRSKATYKKFKKKLLSENTLIL
ncbi:hypothetical protein MPSEU_000027800 [Mayamaea pseudoterrestris]|nr:hypothetical protein MPSEU_000027800 [Mayamaea pseudoterrestris]